MKPLFLYKSIDKVFYEKNIRDYLPQQIIDIHTHVWLDKFITNVGIEPLRTVTWPSLVAKDNSIEDLLETYKLMFPGKQVTPMIFSNLKSEDDFEAANNYIQECSSNYDLPSLIYATPTWSGEEFEARIESGGFLGCKVYLNLSESYIPEKEIRIFDFLPHHQLEVINRHGWIVMLHIPRDARLKDPVNLAQMLEIEKKYPAVKLIIAHVGRAYCNEDLGNAFEVLAETKNMMFDFSANTNQWIFENLINAVGPKRILFGSDLPILRMRMRRICEDGKYINIVPKGLYGDVSDDKNMREVNDETESLTFFMYEEINAFRLASESIGLTRRDIEDIFYNNALSLIEQVKLTK